ncbi:hypothetical protein [Rossellomorea aquimaris]|uniref:hypothetical protein n=1 Tax=Rossellomorea aquimaris TaxID=189382 RepID=UPI0007D053B2|nr:hypothetical protein [Rossellomorea aquimaris]
MKRIFIIVLGLILIACSNQKTFELPVEEYPKTFTQEVNELPKENQEKMKVPTKFPFKVEYKNFSKDQMRNGKVLLTAVDFSHVDAKHKDRINIHFTTMHTENLETNIDTNQMIDLNDEIKAKIKKDEDHSKIIEWTDKDNITHNLGMMTSDYHEPISLQQLVIMANSLMKVSLNK